MTDLYHSIYENEIFVKSRCIWHENTLLDFFRSQLISLGYTSCSDNNKTWQRSGQKVVVCLVDDIFSCSVDKSKHISQAFEKNTIVITDNFINCPTQYQVCRLPSSFFGIYNHVPDKINTASNRRFSMSVNRIDSARLLMLLEIAKRSPNYPDMHSLDYINFNCWSWEGNNSTADDFKKNFKREYCRLSKHFQELYAEAYNLLYNLMPFKNYTFSLEEMHVSSYLNIVMETYSTDDTIAVSEKLFRTLCLPVPWMVYAGRYTVAYFESLGFDTLSDLINHNYDHISCVHGTGNFGDKMVDFVYNASLAVDKFKQMDPEEFHSRCTAAANHNCQLLGKMQQQWPTDFAAWWPGVLEKIQ
jgi:hypothetical protein